MNIFGLLVLVLLLQLLSWRVPASMCLSAFPVTSVRLRTEADIVLHGRTVKRLSFQLNESDCVVFVDKPSMYHHDSRWLQRLVGTHGRLLQDEDEDEDDANPVNPAQNCHAYACSITGLKGLPVNWWIDGKPSVRTNKQNPLSLILNAYYREVRRYPNQQASRFTFDGELRRGDLVVFVRNDGVYTHSGSVIFERSPNSVKRNWIRSKLGESGIAETHLRALDAIYTYAEIRGYRRRIR